MVIGCNFKYDAASFVEYKLVGALIVIMYCVIRGIIGTFRSDGGNFGFACGKAVG
jgi:hypothetical protein